MQGSLNADSAVETLWDVTNIGMDVYSFSKNMTDGNYSSTTVDVAGIIYDTGATLIPFLPSGVAATFKAKRAGNSLRDTGSQPDWNWKESNILADLTIKINGIIMLKNTDQLLVKVSP